MSAALIAQLIIALGPSAFELIPKLAEVWNKGSLTTDEVVALCAPAHKSYQQIRAEELAKA